jgi:hypothetical protein
VSVNINDGGPAFPMRHSVFPNGDIEYGSQGMSLRDYFAAAALQGLMGNSGGPWQADPMCGTGWCNSDASLVALTAYDIADAMIAARERKESSNG